ncbi:MAG: hypothetical protein WA738_16250 [Candidatus Angelobacter sp.]
MGRAAKLALFVILPCLVIAVGAAAYQFFIGFPRTFAGRGVHRVTIWAEGKHFQAERVYYAYNGPDGKELRHGPFQRFDDGRLVQQAMYRDGKIDGAIVYWNVLGDKTQEVYYRAGTPYGWANFAKGKLFNMRQEVEEDGRSVAIKTFDNGRYLLEFNCGELINAAIDPVTGRISSIANPTRRICTQP